MPGQVCAQCHNNTFLFDRARHAIVCDVCGWEQNRGDRANEQFAYDQNRQRAIAFVRARDYASAKPYLDRMRSTDPADPDIYFLHLMGLTDCLQNLLLKPKDAQTFTLVQEHWNTFCRLGGNRSRFLPYFSRRRQKKKEQLGAEMSRAGLLALLCYGAGFALVAAMAAGIVEAVVPLILLTMLAVHYRPLGTLLRLKRERDRHE